MEDNDEKERLARARRLHELIDDLNEEKPDAPPKNPLTPRDFTRPERLSEDVPKRKVDDGS